MNVASKTALRAKAAITPRPRQVSKRRRPRSASGNRAGLRRNRGGLHHLYIWCGRRICQQREDDGATVVRNYYRQGFVAGEDTFVYVRDHLGSVQAVVADDGESFESARRYSPWGETRETAGAGEASDFGYTGHSDHRPSGVVLAQYRGYDARLGRWLSRDPIAERGGLNLHQYVWNDPNGAVDPDGRFPWLTAGLGALGAGFAAFIVGGSYYLDVESDARESESKHFPEDPDRPDPYGGGYRHCVAACRLKEDLGDTGARMCVDLHDWAAESNGDLDSPSDMHAEQVGLMMDGNCEAGCLAQFPPY